jgi:hypothetical protein
MMMPKGDTLFRDGFNALAEQCSIQMRIPEGSAILMESVEAHDGGASDAIFTIRVHVIVPFTVRRGYDYEGDAEEVVDLLPKGSPQMLDPRRPD